MNRRTLLIAGSTGLLLGSAGCLGTLDGTDPDSYAAVDLDCERFEGPFGVLVVGVPVTVPDDGTVVNIEETGILEYDVVEAEMEHARETRSEAEERISEDDDVMSQTGYVDLGNGDRYADVEASFEEYATSSGLYVTYRGEVYQLGLHGSPHPTRLGDAGDTSNSGLTSLEIFAADSVPDDADVIDAVEEGLDEHEHLGYILAITSCRTEGEDRSGGRTQIGDYNISTDAYREISERLGDSRGHMGDWYVGYDAAIYRLTFIRAAH